MKRNDFGATSGSSTLPRHMWSVSGMWPVKDSPLGMWVPHDAAQSRIAELEAEVVRLRIGLDGYKAMLHQAESDVQLYMPKDIHGKRIGALKREEPK